MILYNATLESNKQKKKSTCEVVKRESDWKKNQFVYKSREIAAYNLIWNNSLCVKSEKIRQFYTILFFSALTKPQAYTYRWRSFEWKIAFDHSIDMWNVIQFRGK